VSGSLCPASRLPGRRAGSGHRRGDRAARPGIVLPVLAAAYGLTGRDQEVIRAVFAGLSTREISARLHISIYTVQDHLKVIFAKTGASSRRELAHQLALQFT
jgi:DNA-binding CsgD family transcriptional regulator